MELKKGTSSQLDVVVNKTMLSVNPIDVTTSARVLIFTQPDSQLGHPSTSDKLFISGPGEYEVDSVTIETVFGKGEEADAPNGLYVFVQNNQASVLILPNIVSLPDNVVEKWGAAEVLSLPLDSSEPIPVQNIAKIIKQLGTINALVITADKALDDTKVLHELSSHIETGNSSLKLKDIKSSETEIIELHILTP